MIKLASVILNWYPYLGVPLCSLFVPSDLDGRSVFGMNRSYVFPKGVLAAIALAEGGAGNGGATVGAGVRQSILSAQCLSLPYWTCG